MSHSSHGGSALLEIRALNAWFGPAGRRTHVLHDVDLSVSADRSLGLVGESGSGKTVTIRAALGLVAPGGLLEAHETSWRGEPVGLSGLARLRGREIGFVPQDPGPSLNPLMTIGQHLRETLRVGHDRARDGSVSAITDRSHELLEAVRLPNPTRIMRSRPHELSGGMKQRVLIALAIANRPRLLIADEPTTALDVTTQRQVLSLLDELRREFGMGLILVTHDLGVVAEWCDDVQTMYAGRVVENGPTRPVFDRPAHPYTSALLAAIPRARGDRSLPRPIAGSPPVRPDLLAGCPFSPRCAFATDECSVAPELTEVDTGHRAACVHPLSGTSRVPDDTTEAIHGGA